MEPMAMNNTNSLELTCKECDYTTSWHAGFAYHQASHKVNKAVRCNYCSYSSKYAKIVVRHMKTCHLAISTDDNSHNTKPAADESTVNASKKRANAELRGVRSETGQLKKAFQCRHCSRSYSRKTDLTRHMQNVHDALDRQSALRSVDDSNSKTAPASKVGESDTVVPTELNEAHSETEQIKSYFDCHSCLRSYSRIADLTRHTQSVHGISGSTVKCKIAKNIGTGSLGVKRCKYCPYKSKWSGAITRHMQMVHFNIRRIQCKLCDYRCNEVSNMQRHLKRVHKCFDRNQCILLSESVTSATIDKHKLGVSVNNQPSVHDKSHLSDGLTPAVELKFSSSAGSSQPEHYVSVINKKNAKKFVVKSNSRNVITKGLSTGSSEVGTLVRRSTNISRHVNVAKENLKSPKPKPDEVFKCEVCSRVFTCKTLLQKHSVVHTDYRRYRCSVCGWRSNFSNSIKNHVVNFHNSRTSYVLLSVAEAADTIKSYKQHQSKMAPLKSEKTEQNAGKKYNTSKHFRRSANDGDFVLDDNKCVVDAGDTTKVVLSPPSIDKKIKLQLNFDKLKPLNKNDFVSRLDKTTPLLKCPTCPKIFSDAGSLYWHSMWHADLRCFQCETCGLRSNFYATIRRHAKRVHHERATPRQLSLNEAKSTIESYKAQVEKQVVPVMEKMPTASAKHSKSIMHKKSRLVVGIKPEFSSTRVSSAKHTKAICTICGMKFLSRQALKSHAVVHSDLRRFQCLTCEWRTNFKGNMKNHLVSIHGFLDGNSSYRHMSIEEASETVDEYKSTFPQGASATRKFKTFCPDLKTPSKPGKHRVMRRTELEGNLPVVTAATDAQVRGQKASNALVTKPNYVGLSTKEAKFEINEVAGDDMKKIRKKVKKRGLKSFKCDFCSFSTLYRHSIDRHRRRHHNHEILADVPAACSASSPIADMSSDEYPTIPSPMVPDDLQLQQTKKPGISNRRPLSVGFLPYMCSHCHHRTKFVSSMTRHLSRCGSSAKIVKLSLTEANKTLTEFEKPSSLPVLKTVRKRNNVVSHPEFEENTLQAETPDISSEMNSRATQQSVCLKQGKKRCYECSSCNYQSDRRYNIRKHLNGCDPTAKILEVFDDLKAISLLTQPNKSKCLNLPIKEKGFKMVSKTFVPKYEDTIDLLKLRRFYCVLCGYRSSYKYAVIRHLSTKHTDSDVTVAKMTVKDARKSLHCYDSSARVRKRHKTLGSSSLQTVQCNSEFNVSGGEIGAADAHSVDARTDARMCKSEDAKEMKTPVKAELNLANLRKRGLLSPRIPLVPVCSGLDSNLSSKVKGQTDFMGKGGESVGSDSLPTDLSPLTVSRKRCKTKQKQKAGENMHIFKCSECGYSSNWQHILIRHRQKYHENSETIRLRISRTVSESDSKPAHDLGFNKCSQSLYRSHSQLNLQRTLKLANRRIKRRYPNNPESFKFQCPFCQFCTNWTESLKRHIASIHPEDKPNQTNDEEGISTEIASPSLAKSTPTTNKTSQRFQSASECLTLNKVDGKYFRRFKCSVCPSRKNSKVDVFKHIKNMHSGMGTAKVLSKKFAKDTLAEYFKLHGKHFKKSHCDIAEGCVSFSAVSASRQSHITATDNGDTKSPIKLDLKYSSPSKWQPIESCDQNSGSGDDCSVQKQAVDSKQLVDVQTNWLSCDKCPFMATHSHGLQTHKLRHLLKSVNQLKCDLCSYSCSNQRVLKKHAAVHMPDYRTTCAMEVSSSESILIPADIFSCDQCPFLTKSQTALAIHKQMHQPRTLVRHGCDRCKFWSLDRGTMLRHYHVHQAGYAQKRINSLSNTTLKVIKKCKVAKLSKPAQSSTFIQQSDHAKKTRPLQLVDTAVEIELAALKQKLIASRFRDKACYSSSQLPVQSSPSKEPAPNTDHLIETPSNVENSIDKTTAVSANASEIVNAMIDAEADSGCSKTIRQLWRCEKCPYAVIDIDRLRHHISMHGRGLPFECTYCNYSASTYWCLARHHKLHLLQNQNLLNSQSVKNLILLPPRVKQLPENSCEQDEVGNDSDDPDDLSIFTVPLFDKFRCNRCPFVAEQRLELCSHLRCHVRCSKVSCPFCDYSTESSTDLRSHVLSHFTLPGSELSALPPRSHASKPWTSIVADIELYVRKWCKNQFEGTKNGDLAVCIKVSQGSSLSDRNSNLVYTDENTGCREGRLSRQCKTQFMDVSATYPLTGMLSELNSEVISLDVAQSPESVLYLPEKAVKDNETASSNVCQYCDRLLGSSDLLARHEAAHLIGNQFVVNTGFAYLKNRVIG